MHRISCVALIIASLLPTACCGADGSQKLSLERIFSSKELEPKGYGPVVWDSSGRSYTLLEPSKTVKDSQEIVRYDAALGTRTVILSADQLTPAASKPLAVRSYSISDNGKQILLFANPQKVWRQETRG